MIAKTPGKIHLLGEHAVVYGQPAILATVDTHTTVECRPRQDLTVHFHDHRFGLNGRGKRQYPLVEALEAGKDADETWERLQNSGESLASFLHFFSRAGFEHFHRSAVGWAAHRLGIDRGMEIDVHSDIPVGVGMGSSAAFAVGLVSAMSWAFIKDHSLAQVNEIAWELERFVHGRPSGGDNTAISFGGFTWFEKEQEPQALAVRSDLPKFALVNLGTPKETTGMLVERVRTLPAAERKPPIERLGQATRELKALLATTEQPFFEKFIPLMCAAQENLARLGVSTPAIDGLCQRVGDLGGGAKLCGAGGGGTVLIAHAELPQLIGDLRQSGLEPLETQLGVAGVALST